MTKEILKRLIELEKLQLRCEECDEDIDGKIELGCIFYEISLCEPCARFHIRECAECS